MDYRDPYAGLGLDDSLMRNLVRIVALLRVASQGEMRGKGMIAAACDRQSIIVAQSAGDQPGPGRRAASPDQAGLFRPFRRKSLNHRGFDVSEPISEVPPAG